MTLVTLPFAVLAARLHQVLRHATMMISLFTGALVIAGALPSCPAASCTTSPSAARRTMSVASPGRARLRRIRTFYREYSVKDPRVSSLDHPSCRCTLVRLTGMDAHGHQPALAEPDVGDLQRHPHTVQYDALVAPNRSCKPRPVQRAATRKRVALVASAPSDPLLRTVSQILGCKRGSADFSDHERPFPALTVLRVIEKRKDRAGLVGVSSESLFRFEGEALLMDLEARPA